MSLNSDSVVWGLALCTRLSFFSLTSDRTFSLHQTTAGNGWSEFPSFLWNWMQEGPGQIARRDTRSPCRATSHRSNTKCSFMVLCFAVKNGDFELDAKHLAAAEQVIQRGVRNVPHCRFKSWTTCVYTCTVNEPNVRSPFQCSSKKRTSSASQYLYLGCKRKLDMQNPEVAIPYYVSLCLDFLDFITW